MSKPEIAALTSEEVRQFLDDGFLIIRNVLPPSAIQPLIDELKLKVDVAAKAAIEDSIIDLADTFDDAPFESRLGLICKACSKRNWAWEHYFGETSYNDERQKPRSNGMFTLRTWPSLLDIVESVIGPEIFAHPQYNIRTKLPNQAETVIPWHQDLAFLDAEEAGDTLVINFWIPLVDTRMDNGCMQVMRGTHGLSLLPHNLRLPTPDGKVHVGIEDCDLPDGEIVTAEMNVGDVLMTTECVLHRSLPNISDTVRWSVDTRYSTLGKPTGRPDVPGFVARSLNHPGHVARSALDWKQQFENV